MPADDYYKSLLRKGKEEIMADCCCCDGEHPSSSDGPYVIENGETKRLAEVEAQESLEENGFIQEPRSVPKKFEQAYVGKGSLESGHEE